MLILRGKVIIGTTHCVLCFVSGSLYTVVHNHCIIEMFLNLRKVKLFAQGKWQSSKGPISF